MTSQVIRPHCNRDNNIRGIKEQLVDSAVTELWKGLHCPCGPEVACLLKQSNPCALTLHTLAYIPVWRQFRPDLSLNRNMAEPGQLERVEDHMTHTHTHTSHTHTSLTQPHPSTAERVWRQPYIIVVLINFSILTLPYVTRNSRNAITHSLGTRAMSSIVLWVWSPDYA